MNSYVNLMRHNPYQPFPEALPPGGVRHLDQTCQVRPAIAKWATANNNYASIIESLVARRADASNLINSPPKSIPLSWYLSHELDGRAATVMGANFHLALDGCRALLHICYSLAAGIVAVFTADAIIGQRQFQCLLIQTNSEGDILATGVFERIIHRLFEDENQMATPFQWQLDRFQVSGDATDPKLDLGLIEHLIAEILEIDGHIIERILQGI